MNEAQFAKLDDALGELKTQNAVQTRLLEDHMKSTSEWIKIMDKRMRPVEAHVTFVNRLSKLLVTLVTVAGVLFGILAGMK